MIHHRRMKTFAFPQNSRMSGVTWKASFTSEMLLRQGHHFSDAEEVACSTIVTALGLSINLTLSKEKQVSSNDSELLLSSK
jgi:hypothetical protein